MKAISEELALPIDNWDDIESNKDLNSYCFQYCSVLEKDSSILSGAIPEYVKVETSLGSCAFPTTTQPIGSYIDDYLKARERPDLIKQFQLEEFPMKLQAIERTYIDKIFASCDYYLNGQSNKRSRHLYDIYKLAPFVSFDAAFFRLFAKVRQHRREMNEREQRKGKKQICPSAEPDISLSHVIRSYCSDAFFEQDYYETTKHFIYEYVEYEDIIDQILKIADQLENIV